MIGQTEVTVCPISIHTSGYCDIIGHKIEFSENSNEVGENLRLPLLLPKDLSFKNKLMITFVLVTFLPAIILQYFTYYNWSQAMSNKINDLVQYNLIQTNKNLNMALSAYSDTLFQVFSNDEVIQSVHHFLYDTDAESLLYASKLRSLLAGYTYSKEGIRSLSFFSKSGRIIAFDRATGSSIDTLWNHIPGESRNVFAERLSRETQGALITPTEQVSDGQFVFHIARKLTGYANGQLEDLGYIIISIDEAVLSQSINFSGLENRSSMTSSINFLMNSEQNLISFFDKSRIGKPLSELIPELKPGGSQLGDRAVVLGQPSIVNVFVNEKTGWSIVNVTNESELFAEMYRMQRINLIAGAAMITITTLLIIYFSGLLTQSINKIVDVMKLAQRGILTAKIDHPFNDEFSVIVSSYNKMMVRISELMNETKLAVQKQKESEIRSLEAQINPHFLYNTLDSINWMAIEKEEYEISRMLSGLAQILRYSISQSNKLVYVDEEIQWLGQYLFLQKSRFDDAFEFQIEVGSGLQGVRLYKLLLQPFIENSIIHAFSGRKSGGKLCIRFRKAADDRLYIEIEDNGRGMSALQVKRLMEGSAASTDAKGSGIGVRNVLDRLELYYGDQAGIEITSEVDIGTKISMRIPSMEEQRAPEKGGDG
jgi:two-component system, sensor histidine kinase YesM